MLYGMMLLTSCQTPTTVPDTDACLAWPKTDYAFVPGETETAANTQDTPQTVHGNRVNNARRRAYGCK